MCGTQDHLPLWRLAQLLCSIAHPEPIMQLAFMAVRTVALQQALAASDCPLNSRGSAKKGNALSNS